MLSWAAVAESTAAATDSASSFFRSGSPGSVSSPILAIIAANCSSSVSNCSPSGSDSPTELVSCACANKASISSASGSSATTSSNKASISSAATSGTVTCCAADSISVDAPFRIASISSSSRSCSVDA